MKLIKAIVCFFIIIFILTQNSYSSYKAQEYVQKSSWKFNASETKSIKVKNNIPSDIYFHKSLNNKIEVKWKADKKSSEAFDRGKIKIEAGIKNGQLTIISDMPLRDKLSIKVRQARSRFDIYVPKNSVKKIGVSSGAGDVLASDIFSDIEIDIGSGDIVISDTRGNLELNTGSGGISMSAVWGSSDINTGSGDVSIRNMYGNIDINTGSGDISINTIKGSSESNSGSGDIELKGFLSPGTNHEISTGSGNILIMIPRNLSVEVEVKPASGSIKTNLPFVIYSQSKKYFHGKLGDGKAKLYIESGSGDITIKSL